MYGVVKVVATILYVGHHSCGILPQTFRIRNWARFHQSISQTFGDITGLQRSRMAEIAPKSRVLDGKFSIARLTGFELSVQSRVEPKDGSCADFESNRERLVALMVCGVRG